MNFFLWNLLLAIFWSAINGVLSLQTLTIGFIIGYGVLFVARRALGDDRYFRKSYLIISLLLFVALELFKSSLQIVVDILTLKHRMRPGIVKIPLDAKSDLEITLLANLISLTPGTLSLDVSQDRRELFVHVMYLQGDDLEPVRKAIKDNYERKILELLR
jgi:multicomponent Na+:H+ antiporter subunit E